MTYFRNNNNSSSPIRQPRMWRKRYIPNEIVDISSDEVVYRDNKIIVTKWDTIKPRGDFQKGISFYLLDKGMKISKFFKQNNELVRYYCDTLDIEYNESNDEYIFTDLLLDLNIMPGGNPEVLDMDELIDAQNDGLITKVEVEKAKRIIEELLDMVENNNFPPKEIIELWDRY